MFDIKDVSFISLNEHYPIKRQQARQQFVSFLIEDT